MAPKTWNTSSPAAEEVSRRAQVRCFAIRTGERRSVRSGERLNRVSRYQLLRVQAVEEVQETGGIGTPEMVGLGNCVGILGAMLFPLLYLGTAGPNSVLIVNLLSYAVAFSLVAVTTKRNKQEKALIREMEAAEADKRRPSVIGARSRGSPPSVRLDRSDEAGVGDRQPVVGGLPEF